MQQSAKCDILCAWDLHIRLQWYLYQTVAVLRVCVYVSLAASALPGQRQHTTKQTTKTHQPNQTNLQAQAMVFLSY